MVYISSSCAGSIIHLEGDAMNFLLALVAVGRGEGRKVNLLNANVRFDGADLFQCSVL